jgi:NTP pyrophosphatase (non-canonical NTP hydrolase)
MSDANPGDQLLSRNQLPSDQLLNISQINGEFRKIAAHKGWQAYHNPKNLAAAIAVEAGELLAEFQWLSADESNHLNAEQKVRVADEVADVIMYLTELSARLDIDIATAIQSKIEKNNQRFRAE